MAFGERGESVAPVSSEGGVVEDVLVGGEGITILGVESEVEVAGDEDAGGGVLGDMVFDGVEEGNGVLGVEVGAEVGIDDEKLLIGG